MKFPTTSRARRRPALSRRIDYVVVKIPKWQFEKFPGADENLGPQMKSVGEVMAIGPHLQRSADEGAAFARDRQDASVPK